MCHEQRSCCHIAVILTPLSSNVDFTQHPKLALQLALPICADHCSRRRQCLHLLLRRMISSSTQQLCWCLIMAAKTSNMTINASYSIYHFKYPGVLSQMSYDRSCRMVKVRCTGSVVFYDYNPWSSCLVLLLRVYQASRHRRCSPSFDLSCI